MVVIRFTYLKLTPIGFNKVSKMVWEEIHGFDSLSEFKRFVIYIEKQVDSGYAEELEVNNQYGKGEIYGGRWFKDCDSGEIWRLIEPDFPFRGMWEPVVPPTCPNKS